MSELCAIQLNFVLTKDTQGNEGWHKGVWPLFVVGFPYDVVRTPDWY